MRKKSDMETDGERVFKELKAIEITKISPRREFNSK